VAGPESVDTPDVVADFTPSESVAVSGSPATDSVDTSGVVAGFAAF